MSWQESEKRTCLPLAPILLLFCLYQQTVRLVRVRAIQATLGFFQTPICLFPLRRISCGSHISKASGEFSEADPDLCSPASVAGLWGLLCSAARHAGQGWVAASPATVEVHPCSLLWPLSEGPTPQKLIIPSSGDEMLRTESFVEGQKKCRDWVMRWDLYFVIVTILLLWRDTITHASYKRNRFTRALLSVSEGEAWLLWPAGMVLGLTSYSPTPGRKKPQSLPLVTHFLQQATLPPKRPHLLQQATPLLTNHTSFKKATPPRRPHFLLTLHCMYSSFLLLVSLTGSFFNLTLILSNFKSNFGLENLSHPVL